MDKCKEIQDLVLMDYVDGQLDIAIKDQLERHLSTCSSCQNFAQEVKQHLIMPFENSDRQQVPLKLWSAIQEKIYQEQSSKQGVLENIKQWLNSLTLPQLVPALVSFTMVFFVTSTIFINQQIKQATDQEEGSYVAYVLASEATMSQGDSEDLGTPIEKYFL